VDPCLVVGPGSTNLAEDVGVGVGVDLDMDRVDAVVELGLDDASCMHGSAGCHMGE
jgi:hypothetical protein